MKKLIFIIALGIFTLIISSQTAIGVNWVKIIETKQGTNYIDSDSIIKTKKGIVRYWMTKKYLNEDKTDYVMYYSETYCQERRFRFLQLTMYLKDGTPSTDSIPTEWKFINPDSNFELVYEFVCSR
jgi:hypothetical protein